MIASGMAHLFSIPMRGNELDQMRGEVFAGITFSIPMRGNEITEATGDAPGYGSFRSP